MASRYGGITGSKRISEDFHNINTAFENVQTEMDANKNVLENHIASKTAHKAEYITYTGQVPGDDVKEAIDNVNGRISEIVAQSGNDNTEIVDARGGYPVLGDRLNASDAEVSNKVDKGSLFINVKDYGAKGDGVTNDSAAIQAAIDTGKPVFLPEGNFFIGDISLNNVSVLLGVGKGRSVITINGSTTTALKVNSENSIIRDIEIDHTGTPTSGAAISIYTGNYSTIENVYIRNTYHGITFQNSQSVKVYNIEMWGFVGYGLYFNGLNNDIFVSDAFINGETESSQPGPGHGIRIVDKGEALTFHNVEVILCDYAMSTDSANNSLGNRPAYCKFTDCFFDSSTNGVLLDKIVSFKFISCWFSNRPSNGCVVINSEDILFSGSDFVNNGGHGCLVQNTSKRIKFLGCDFIANSSSDPGMYHGLIIAGGTTDFVINECTATNGMGFSGTQSWGIFVANGSSDRYIIKNNLVTGNVSGGVSDNGTGTNKSVKDNF